MFQPPGEKHTTVFCLFGLQSCLFGKNTPWFSPSSSENIVHNFFFLRLFAYKQHWAHSSQLLYWAQLIKISQGRFLLSARKKTKQKKKLQIAELKKKRKRLMFIIPRSFFPYTASFSQPRSSQASAASNSLWCSPGKHKASVSIIT